jgi:hypothetical protein
MGETKHICMRCVCIQKYNYCMCAHEHSVSHLCHVPPIAVWVDRPPFGSHSYSLLCNTSTVSEPNNGDIRPQFTPKCIFSLDHMNTQRNCRHDDTKKNVTYFFVCFSFSYSTIFLGIIFLSLIYCTWNGSACRDGGRAPAHWQNDFCLLGYDAVYTGI